MSAWDRLVKLSLELAISGGFLVMSVELKLSQSLHHF